MVEIIKLPPGEAIGARDLQKWSHQRLQGRTGSGFEDTREGTSKLIIVRCFKCKFIQELHVLKGSMLKFKCKRCGSDRVQTKRDKSYRRRPKYV